VTINELIGGNGTDSTPGDVDHRGVMQFDPGLRAGFNAIRVQVRAGAPGVPREKLAKLVAAAERSCAATDALRNSTSLTVQLVD